MILSSAFCRNILVSLKYFLSLRFLCRIFQTTEIYACLKSKIDESRHGVSSRCPFRQGEAGCFYCQHHMQAF